MVSVVRARVRDNAVRGELRDSELIRRSTPALAAQGFGTKKLREVADIITSAPLPSFHGCVAVTLRDRIRALANGFPVYEPAS